MSETNKRAYSRDYGLDLCRIFACFCLLPGHYVAYRIGNSTTDIQYICTVVESSAQILIPLFLMISGALFLGKEKVDIKKLYTKNIFHILLVYVFWSAVYAVFDVLINLGNVTDVKSLISWILIDIRDSHYHMWYLPMIIAIYILTPIIHAAIGNGKNPEILKYAVIVFAVFGIIVPTLLRIPVESDTYTMMLEKIDVGTFAGWMGFFITGYYLYINRKAVTSKQLRYILIAAAVSVVVMLGVNAAKVPTDGINLYLSFFSVPCFITGCTVFLLFTRISTTPSEKKKAVVSALSDCMFGVYCVHDLILSLVDMVFSRIPDSLYVIRLVAGSVIAFAISIGIILVMRKSRILRKIAV